jgi:serine/threonine protein kinase
MSASQVCPEPARLQQLLEGDLPSNQQVELTSHLDTCSNCQKTLENLAGGNKDWPAMASEIGKEQPEPDAVLEQLMHNLKQKASEAVTQAGPSTGPATGIEFLGPPQKPGHLGSIDQYQVTELIGRGGMGIVFKAFDPGLHRFVAIKVLASHLAASETARDRFKREARAAAAVSHEHVVGIYHVAEFNGLPFLVMEYVRGFSLQQRLEQTGPLKLKEILRIGMQIASGLAAAHAQGLVHRDIKPANILLENGVERVKITDFGLARAANDASLTQSGVVAGTPHHMAPEQARGEAVDHRADLFSLGTVLYSLCTGRVPFQADTVVAVLYNVCQETPRSIQDLNPEIPAWMVQLIARLHAKNKAGRYQSAAEVAELLGRHLSRLQEPMLAPQRQEEPPTASRTQRRWLMAAAVIVLVLGGLGLTDALGVTNVVDFVATTLRIRTRDGTLVLEISDPNIDVAIDGEEVTIRGAGVHEIRLRPGTHVLHGTRAGQSVDLGTITISRGDKKVLQITQEGSEVAGPVAAAEKTQRIRAFTSSDKTITRDGVVKDDDSLCIDATGKRTVRLYELTDPGVEDCILTYRARIKSHFTEGQAYLEMLCHFPGMGEAFSRGLDNPVKGTTDWATYETSFFLKKGERPDWIKLNVVTESKDKIWLKDKGSIWLKDIEILRSPLNPALFSQQPGGNRMDSAAENMFRRLDQNQDGVLNKDEMPENLRAELSKWDTDKNGVIDLNEFKAWFQARMQAITKGRGFPSGRPFPFGDDKKIRGVPTSPSSLTKSEKIKTFSPPDKPITQDGVSVEEEGWKIESKAGRTVRLFEVTPGAGLEQCKIVYRAKIKAEKAVGRVYLEMWCRVPGIGEAFSKGLDNPVMTGTTDWKTYEIPFFLEKGQQADLIKLNIVAEGESTIWVKDVELSRGPLP